jgi:hypothetical protein
MLGIPTGVEEEFLLPIIGTDPVLGFIDVRDPISLYDYKFTKRLKTPEEVDTSIQLSVYDLATDFTSPNMALISLIPPNTRSEAKVLTTYRSAEQMTPAARRTRAARTIGQIQNTARAIANEIFTPVDDPRVCSWCGYRETCQSLRTDEYPQTQPRQ